MDKIIDNRQHKKGGGVAYGFEDIQQCLDTIFHNEKGEVPLQPNIGCNILEAIGENPDNALQIAKTIVLKEFPLQEPRIEVVDVKTYYLENFKLAVQVKYKSKLTSEERISEYYV